MIAVLGVELDFDVTAPDDLARYIAASKKMAKDSENAPPLPASGESDGDGGTIERLQEYQDWVATNCKLITDWIDNVFGDGTSNRLLGPKTSLSKILEVYDLLEEAITKQGETVGARLRQFMPNRRTKRRGQFQ